MAKKTNHSEKLSKAEVSHIAKLANLHIDPKRFDELINQFEETVSFVDQLQEVDISNVPSTSQVTGQVNVFREDKIDLSRTLSQKEALRNSPRSHNGYFVVPKILDK